MFRAGAAIVAAAALVVAAPAGGATRAGVSVSPQAPVVGKRATIVVRTPRRVAHLSLRLVSPTGVLLRVRLHRTGPRLWRASFHFPDDGEWLLRALPGRLAGSVWVQQPAAPMPPWRPAPKPNALSGILGQGALLVP